MTDQPPGLRLWDKGSSLRAPQALPGQRWSGLHGRTWGRPGPQLGGVGDMGGSARPRDSPGATPFTEFHRVPDTALGARPSAETGTACSCHQSTRQEGDARV